MSRKNRQLAAKFERSRREKRAFIAAVLSREVERPMSDQRRLTVALAGRPDTVEVAGVRVSRCDDVKARKAARQTIRSVHW